MDKLAVLDQLRIDIDAVADLADASDLDTLVPTCGSWTMGDLVGHLGTLLVVSGSHLEDDRPDRRISRRSGPTPPLGDPRPWFRQRAAVALARLASADFARSAPTFLGRRTVAWWARRAMLELNLHRFDAELAAGASAAEATPVPTEVATVGIEEVTEFIQAYGNVLSEQLVGHTVHLHDHRTGGGEWFITLGRPVTVCHDHARADVAVRGDPEALFRCLWNRPTVGALDVIGDREVLDDLLDMIRT